MSIKHNLPAIAWALVILLLCGYPGGDQVATHPLAWLLSFDKLGHVFLFAVFVFLLCSGFRRQGAVPGPGDRRGVTSIATASVYGLLIEGMQFLMIPNRHFELLDLGADIAGCLLGYAVFRWFGRGNG